MKVPAEDAWLPPGFTALCALGAGGMGEVFLVENGSGEKFAAKRLKLPASGASSGSAGAGGYDAEIAAARLRFRREFVAIANVSHPGIIHAHEFFETPGHLLYTMDYIEGPTLKDYFTGGHWRGEPFAWTEKADKDTHRDFGQMQCIRELSHGHLLTDDYAPVDNLLVPVFASQ